jgi:hypothetical protein
VLRIGSQQDTLYQFGSIGGVDISSRGVIAVLDAQAGAIRLYDSTGKYLRSMGRSGQGPGELNRSVGDMVLSIGDTVLIANGARSSVTRLLMDGRSLASFGIPDDESTSSVALDSRWQEHPHGGAVQQIIGRPRDSAEVYPPYHLVRLTASGAADTIFTLPGGRTIQPDDSVKKPRRNLAIEGGETAHDGPMPEIRVFAPEPVWALTSDGAVHYAMTSEYAISMYDSAAVLKRIVRRPVKAQPLTASDKEEGLQLFRKSMTEGRSSRGSERDAVVHQLR